MATREFSDTSRDKMAGRGVAMPDGSYPIPDKDALRRAIASYGRAKNPAAVKRHIIKRARALGATEMLPEDWSAKAFVDMKAEPMDAPALDRWLDGKIPRRILVVPFGGPLPGGKAGLGLDLDGEYFDADTDLYGRYAALRRSRERLVDWHHDNDPTGRMKGAILGRVVLDEKPEDDGVWADFWANAGEQRRALIARLEQAHVPLYGSSQAVSGAVRKADDGHIEVWPLIRHTITTSPQNTLAVVPPLKALLTADLPDDVGIAALKAALVGLDDIVPSLRSRFSDAGSGLRQSGNGAGKAGRVLSRKNEALVAAIAEQAERLLAQLRKAVPEPEATDEREPDVVH